MTEKIIKLKRIVCDACGFKEVVEVEATFLTRAPKTPATWGYDMKKQDQLCPTCKSNYTSEYENFYKKWKESRKGKEGR